MMKYWFLLLLLLLLAGSCKLGEEFVRPDLGLPDRIDGDDAGGNSVSELKWWELYQDTVLQHLIRQTLAYNKEMQMAAARVKEMEAARRISKAALFPGIDAKIAGEREYDASPSFTYEAKGLLSWELDLWGKLRWAEQVAVTDYLKTVEGKNALQLTLVAQVAQAYFELIALDQELKIVRQTLTAREEGVRLAKLRFEGGLTSETSLKQAQVELARTQTLIPELERNVCLKENAIALLAGQYPGPTVRGKSLKQQRLPAMLPVGLPSELLQRRPDIRQAEYKLRGAYARVGVAYTSLFPKITLTGHYGLESGELSHFLQSPYFLLGGGMLAPVLNMGKNRSKLKAEKAVREQEIRAYEQAVLTAFSEVRDALTTSRKIREIRESRQKLEEASRSALELAHLQYINGVVSYLNVLDAQRGYFDAQVALNTALRDELLATVQLYKVLGGAAGEEGSGL